jgi:IPT/TIG domain
MRGQLGARSLWVVAFAAVLLVTAGSALAAARVTLPTIASFTPTKTKPAKTVTVTGKNLKGATAVTVDGMTMKFKVDSATKIVVTLSSKAKTGAIKVTTPAGTATSTHMLSVT